MTHKYKLKYNVDVFNRPEGYSIDDPDFNKETGCMTDALILGSILYAPDGGVSHMFVSMDKDKKPINAHDMFMAWGSLTFSLIDYPDMSQQHKSILSHTHEDIKAMILSNRGVGGGGSGLDPKEINTNPRFLIGKFMLDDEGNVIPATDFLEWAEWFGNPIHRYKRVVSNTLITKDIVVSTVFLALDHGYPELSELDGIPPQKYKPTLWESMVFGGELDDTQERYTSVEDAIKGHLALVDEVRATLK